MHIKNKIWERVNELILTEAILNSRAKKTAKLRDLPDTDPVSVYSRCLKSGVKAGQVHRKFTKWYDVDRMTPGDTKLSCRFTEYEQILKCCNMGKVIPCFQKI